MDEPVDRGDGHGGVGKDRVPRAEGHAIFCSRRRGARWFCTANGTGHQAAVAVSSHEAHPHPQPRRAAIMAERVLGNVVSSGIKVLVLAVIVGIGSTLFAEFTAGFGGAQPTVDDALSIMLAALSLLALGIFGPGIANGIVAGGPQLGAGSAIGAGLAAGGAALAAGGAARMALSAGGAAARGGAYAAGAGSSAFSHGASGSIGGFTGGALGVAKAGASAALSPLRRAAASMRDQFRAGASGSSAGSGGSGPEGGISPGGAPAWASAMRRRQNVSQGVSLASSAVRGGDGGGAGSSVSLSEEK